MQVERGVPSDSATRAGARSSAVTMAWALEMQAVGSGRLSCRQQLYITRSHKYRHDRFHLYNVAEA